MLQYLLNATAIWLLSLMVFDIFLRKESFHSYNRAYLLGSFMLGLLVPLISLEGDEVIYATGMNVPVEQVAIARQAIVESNTANAFFLSWENWLLITYVIGATISFLFLLKEMFVLIRLYRHGIKSRDGVWTIIETGKEHSPFSSFRFIFLNSKANYNQEQLHIILAHEERHGDLLHFIDLLFMQLAKVVFWFHPLVYAYYNRLMIVHEYQADATVEKSTEEYGHFLVEQAMLRSAPVIAHSFNRSPIKKRILMLSKRNTKPAKTKLWLVIPVLLLTVSCFKKEIITDNTRRVDGDKITYRGNVFEMNTFPDDTFFVEDPVTKEQTMAIRSRGPEPAKLNGKSIYETDKVDAPAELNDKTLRTYLLKNLKSELSMLEDGKYRFEYYNLVIDDNGEVVFFDYHGLMAYDDATQAGLSKSDAVKTFDKEVPSLLHNAPRLKPAMLAGKKVPSIMVKGAFEEGIITMKNGKMQM